jgi:hypothetical protein
MKVNLNSTAGRVSVEVASLREASRALWAHVDGEGLGASDMLKGFGNVTENGKVLARVTYNGRVWNADGSEVAL